MLYAVPMNEHRQADTDHTPDHDSDVDQCRICGLATTSDGKNHGDDEMSTQTFPVRLDVEFSDEEITENILWSGCFQYTWWVDYQEIPGGIRISYCDPDDDTVPQEHKNVLFNDIRRVMGNICADAYPNAKFYAYAKRAIMDGIRTGDWDFDSDSSDEIMQIAVFGWVYCS